MVSTLTFSDISQFLDQYQSLMIDGPVDFLSNIKQYQDDYYMLNLIKRVCNLYLHVLYVGHICQVGFIVHL